MKKEVDEFICYWRVQCEASLPLTTEDGKVTLACYEHGNLQLLDL